MDVDQHHRVLRDTKEFQLVGVAIKPGGSAADLVKIDNGSLARMEVQADVSKLETCFMPRKRGRPPKGQTRTTHPVRIKKEEEDVCFICFDGGSLVLCDRRTCPKAYHPSCIKREETFFRSRARWSCGWHICSSCQKAAHYMCYTCTYSLCKGCAKGADYVSVRENFGFCGICLRTILLIENCELGNKEECEVDFDDKTSWEYLFKVYWVLLKSKLSLTLDELKRGQSAWSGDLIIGSTGETYNTLNHGRHEKCSVRVSSCVDMETNESKRQKTIDHCDSVRMEDSNFIEELGMDKMTSPESTSWRSLELLERNNSERIKGIDDQNSVCEDDSTSTEKLGADKKHPLLQSTSWVRKELSETNDSKRRKRTTRRKPVYKDSTNSGKAVSEKLPLPESRNWASKELLKFVGRVKNGDTSVLSLSEVQDLLLEYIEKNNLRDSCLECEVLCDAMLKNLFGRARVSQTELPKLLKSHFLIQENTHEEVNLSVRRLDTAPNQGESNCLPEQMLDMGEKHEACKLIYTQALQNDLNAFETIDSRNIKLMYLRRKQMENLVEDADACRHKVVGSIVRIKIPNGDQKADKYRLVLVVGTKEVAQQCKIDVRKIDLMLEIINVNKKEIISIDGISNQDCSEDECRRFRRSIKIGLSKFLNGCDIQEKAMILQAVRVNLQGSGTLQLNHLCDRSNRKVYEKKLLDNEQHQLHEIPVVHSDQKMDQSNKFDDNPDAGELNKKLTDESLRSKGSWSNREEREHTSPRIRDYNLNDVGTRANETSVAIFDQSGRKSSLETGKVLTAEATWGSSYVAETSNSSTSLVASEPSPIPNPNRSPQSMNGFHTSNVWLSKDHTGKTRGPLSLSQLLKGNSNRHFPADMRILKTSEKKYCSVLSEKALDGKYQENIVSTAISTGGDDGCNSERIGNADRRRIEGKEVSKLENGRLYHKINDESVEIKDWNCHSSSQAALADLAKCDGKILDCQLLPVTTVIDKLWETTSGSGMEGSRITVNSDENDSNWNLVKTRQSHGRQGLKKHLDGHSAKFSEHNRSPPPVSSISSCLDFSYFPAITPAKSASNRWDSQCTIDSITKTMQLNEEIDFFELPGPNPTSNYVPKNQASLNKPSPSSWSTASSLVSDPASHPEALECREHSPKETTTDQAVTPSSISCQHPRSPSKPADEELNWRVIMNDSNDFSFDESVSDLLAEVEALESRCGIDSPTSIMNHGVEFTDAPKNDCFSSAEVLGPLSDLIKGNALSTSALTEEPHVGYEADMLQYQKMSSAQSGIGMKKTDHSHQREASANILVSVPSTTTWEEVAAMDMPWRLGPVFTSPKWGTSQGNVNLSWGGLTGGGNSNMNWGIVDCTLQENGRSFSSYSGSPGIWGNLTRHGNDRISSKDQIFYGREYGSDRIYSKDQNFHGRDYDFDRGRTNRNRQTTYDMVNGKTYQRQAPKRGQETCKYYETGYCNKGVSCSHWHP